ncbi:hypothetical protein Tco_1498231 [Tanacetum coccineum]
MKMIRYSKRGKARKDEREWKRKVMAKGIGEVELTLISLKELQMFNFFLQMGFTLILATVEGLGVGLSGDVIRDYHCDDDGALGALGDDS